MKAISKLQGKWAVVTGASSGIGLEFSHQLAAAGVNLVMISNDRHALEQESRKIIATYRVDAMTLCVDLAGAEAPNDVMAFLGEHWIEPTILINNAGIFSFREVTATSSARVNLFINLHVRAVTELSRLMARKMTGYDGGGYILNMASMACWTPMPGIALYAATKAYIRVFTRALALEMRGSGVKVMVCCPGGIATDLFGLPANLQRLAVRLGVLYTPKRFVRNALKRLVKGRAQYINGFINRLGILTVGVCPARVRILVKKLMLDRGIVKG